MQTTPETVLASRLGVPRTSLTKWRKAGTLIKDTHYVTDDHAAILITKEGEAEILKLAGILAPPPEPQRVPVLVVALGVRPRLLRAKLLTGTIITVRLTAPRVFAGQFRRNDRLDVIPTEHEGIYEYDGPRPRRIRI